MKKVIACLSILTVVASISLGIWNREKSSSLSVISEISSQNVEALADYEVDMELLKELANKEIWIYLIGVWAPGDTALRCITGGEVKCPLE